jgi:cysteinyl-tRNA synthetase
VALLPEKRFDLKSDKIRDELLKEKVLLKDGPNKTTWELEC